MSKQGFWFFIIFVIVIILAAIIFFYSISDRFNSNYLDIDNLLIQQGVEVEVNENTILRFDYSGESYSLFIEDLYSGGGSIKKGLKVIIFSLGESKEIDLDNDGYEDILVDLRKRGNDYFVYLRFIENFVCTESWECTDWGPCINGYMKRVCVDQSLCGTSELKPEVQRSC